MALVSILTNCTVFADADTVITPDCSGNKNDESVAPYPLRIPYCGSLTAAIAEPIAINTTVESRAAAFHAVGGGLGESLAFGVGAVRTSPPPPPCAQAAADNARRIENPMRR